MGSVGRKESNLAFVFAEGKSSYALNAAFATFRAP
jgi:hypothetical protein